MILSFALVGIALVATPSDVSAQLWTNICRSQDIPYCADVGKDAHNNKWNPNPPILRGIRLGKIVGVAWRPRGSLISLPGSPVRVSPRDAFYYIIDDGGPWSTFVRQCREIDARRVAP